MLHQGIDSVAAYFERLLSCGSINIDPASVFVLTCQTNHVLVETQTHSNAGGNAYETPLRERIKGAT